MFNTAGLQIEAAPGTGAGWGACRAQVSSLCLCTPKVMSRNINGYEPASHLCLEQPGEACRAQVSSTHHHQPQQASSAQEKELRGWGGRAPTTVGASDLGRCVWSQYQPDSWWWPPPPTTAWGACRAQVSPHHSSRTEAYRGTSPIRKRSPP